jgi:predicted transcriptional regulator of viral defense system
MERLPLPQRALRAISRSGLRTLHLPNDRRALSDQGVAEHEIGAAIQALERLGMLRHVAHGVYEVRDPRGVGRASFERLVAARIGTSPHLATGWWALAHHGLTQQDVRELIVLVPTNRREFVIAGRRVRPAKVAEDRLWGGRTTATGLRIATAARSLCDSAATRPARIPAPRLAEALERLLGGDRGAHIRSLTAALNRFGSPAASRRIGYLVELIAGADVARPLLVGIGQSPSATPLDIGETGGELNSRWRIRTRLSEEALLEHRETR